jgi:hypothetical protein
MAAVESLTGGYGLRFLPMALVAVAGLLVLRQLSS